MRTTTTSSWLNKDASRYEPSPPVGPLNKKDVTTAKPLWHAIANLVPQTDSVLGNHILHQTNILSDPRRCFSNRLVCGSGGTGVWGV